MKAMSLGVPTAILRRPDLWRVALTQLFRMAPRGWWRRRPFLPIADRAYMEFRAVTHYGDKNRPPAPTDVIAWLEWCRAGGPRRP